MKPSTYNFTWPAGDPDKAMVFNSLTMSLAEIGTAYLDLLNVPQFDYHTLPGDAKQFIDGLKQGGFVLDDAADELKILKFAYNGSKYNQMSLALTIAPTLRCNFACTYCYEQSGDDQDKRDGQHPYMPESVQESLLKYIERAAKMVKNVFITWFGGEPLLGKDIIFDLSKKIMAITDENKIGYDAIMVTNGYLLAGQPEMVQKIKESRINNIQITMDGPPEVHNVRRMLKGNRGPTFDSILEGIRLLAAGGVQVNLRINVDRFNTDDALKLLDILEDNNLKDIGIHLGHVRADTAGCKSIESSCATIEEFAVINQDFRKALRQRGFKTGQTPFYPRIAHPCVANRMNAFVIDPDGDLYKCWSEIGEKSARIGNMADFRKRVKKERMHEIRWLTWEPFEYADCVKCNVLPICMGSCGYRAMFVNKDRADCAEWKYSLEHYIRERFKREKEIKASSDSGEPSQL